MGDLENIVRGNVKKTSVVKKSLQGNFVIEKRNVLVR